MNSANRSNVCVKCCGKLSSPSPRKSDPLFNATDACRGLGLSETSKACERLDEDEKVLLRVQLGSTDFRLKSALFVTEAGLYHLFEGSRKEERRFPNADRITANARQFPLTRLEFRPSSFATTPKTPRFDVGSNTGANA